MSRPSLRVVSYVRDLSIQTPDKFSQFDLLTRRAKQEGAEAILIASPRVLGDNYQELITNMEKLAAADLAIVIVPPRDLERRSAQRN